MICCVAAWSLRFLCVGFKSTHFFYFYCQNGRKDNKMGFFEKYLENAGPRIKKWATWIFAIEFIGGLIAYLAGMITGLSYGNIIPLLLLPLIIIVLFGLSWVTAILLYGFGELIENSGYLLNQGKASNINDNQSSAPNYNSNNNLGEASKKSQKSIDLSDISASDIYRLSHQLQKSLSFVSESGMRAYLQMTKDPVIDKILELPDDQIKPTIKSLIIKYGSWWCSCGAKNSINSTQCSVCYKKRED